MKKVWAALAVLVFTLSLSLQSCKSKPKDADLLATAQAALTANPELNGITVSVKDGIATLTGEAKNASLLATAESLIKSVKGVKSVTNNVSVAVPAPAVPELSTTGADVLSKAVSDALKDFPTVQGIVTDQVLKLTGEIKKDKLQALMMGLSSLKTLGLKSIDTNELIKK